MATDLERLTVLIEANTKSYERAMLRLQKQTDQAIRGAGKSIKGLNLQLAAAASTAKTLAGVFGAGFLAGGLGAIATELPAIVKSVADLGDEADKIGITAEQLQELNFQAEQTGASAETMATGLEFFSKQLADARTGSGELYKLLKANGVALDDIAKMNVNQALRVFVDILGKAGDATDRLKMSAIGFGRGAGTDLALTFAGGTLEMQAFAKQAHDTAQIIDNETVKSAQDLDDKFTLVLGTISRIVKSGVVDAFGDIADEIQRIVGWIEALQRLGSDIKDQPNPMAGALPEEFDAADARARARDAIREQNRIADRINSAFKLVEEDDLGPPVPKSKLPPPTGGGHRAGATKAIHDQHKAVVDLIAELQRELSLVGATNEQQRISNELHRAGAAATEADKAKITELVTAIEAQETAQQRLIDRMDELRDAAGGALDAFAQSIQRGEGPLKALKAALEDVLQTIIRIAEQKFITNLFGAFGTAGGGFFGGLSAPALAVAGGGRSRSGGGAMNVHITASPSPLLDLKITKAMRAAEDRAVARGPAVASNNNRRFATP